METGTRIHFVTELDEKRTNIQRTRDCMADSRDTFGGCSEGDLMDKFKWTDPTRPERVNCKRKRRHSLGGLAWVGGEADIVVIGARDDGDSLIIAGVVDRVVHRRCYCSSNIRKMELSID